jgi:hypothetical protein
MKFGELRSSQRIRFVNAEENFFEELTKEGTDCQGSQSTYVFDECR